jgi:hypothetical protein
MRRQARVRSWSREKWRITLRTRVAEISIPCLALTDRRRS